jgi:hypothetical protein
MCVLVRFVLQLTGFDGLNFFSSSAWAAACLAYAKRSCKKHNQHTHIDGCIESCTITHVHHGDRGVVCDEITREINQALTT